MSFPHPLQVCVNVERSSRATGARHVKVKHLRRGDQTACKIAKTKRNSPKPVVPEFADDPADVTCKRCLKYVRGVGSIHIT